MAKDNKRNKKSNIVKKFTNDTEKVFVGMYGGKEYVLQPGEAVALPEFLAIHLAKQLAYRELQSKADEKERELRATGEKGVVPSTGVGGVEPEKRDKLAGSFISEIILRDPEPKAVEENERDVEDEKEEEFPEIKEKPKAKTTKKTSSKKTTKKVSKKK